MAAKAHDFDVVIAGGGYVGLGLALALQNAAPKLTVMVADMRPAAAIDQDERASAIAAAARSLLMQLGVWDKIEPDAQPINDMIVTDSKLHDVVRPVFLTFDGQVEEGKPFAHMVPNHTMVTALRDAAIDAGVDYRAPMAVNGFATENEKTQVQMGDGTSVTTRLLVAADGVRSKLRDLAGIRTVKWQYDQAGIVATVRHERPHHGRAEEHFLPSGPFAILPLKGNRSSLVWTERRDEAQRLVDGDDFVFEVELERRFGHHLGEVHLDGPRQSFPLGLTLARDFVRPRFALVGDAAHGIHPISGQGLNLGFRDIAALAEVVVEAHRLGLDIGASTILERYQRWRRFDTYQMGVVTDVLNRLFSNKSDGLRAVRDFGLGLVDRMPGLKRFFIKEAAGMAGEPPRLMKGEAI